MLHQCTFAQNRPKSVFMSFDPMLILHIQCQFIKGSLPKTKRENVGIFPKSGTSFPLPPFLEPNVCEKKKLWFILHFRTLGTFLVFTKMFTFWVVLWFVEVGTGDPPPLKRKIPTLSRFVRFFYRMSTRGPKTKLT